MESTFELRDDYAVEGFRVYVHLAPALEYFLTTHRSISMMVMLK